MPLIDWQPWDGNNLVFSLVVHFCKLGRRNKWMKGGNCHEFPKLIITFHQSESESHVHTCLFAVAHQFMKHPPTRDTDCVVPELYINWIGGPLSVTSPNLVFGCRSMADMNRQKVKTHHELWMRCHAYNINAQIVFFPWGRMAPQICLFSPRIAGEDE